MTATGDGGRERAVLPRLHVVTDDEVLARADFLKTAARVLEAGEARLALHVRGPVEICCGTGRTVDRTQATRLCRCGGSENKPFCDGSHRRIGFRSG